MPYEFNNGTLKRDDLLNRVKLNNFTVLSWISRNVSYERTEELNNNNNKKKWFMWWLIYTPALLFFLKKKNEKHEGEWTQLVYFSPSLQKINHLVTSSLFTRTPSPSKTLFSRFLDWKKFEEHFFPFRVKK